MWRIKYIEFSCFRWRNVYIYWLIDVIKPQHAIITSNNYAIFTAYDPYSVFQGRCARLTLCCILLWFLTVLFDGWTNWMNPLFTHNVITLKPCQATPSTGLRNVLYIAYVCQHILLRSFFCVYVKVVVSSSYFCSYVSLDTSWPLYICRQTTGVYRDVRWSLLCMFLITGVDRSMDGLNPYCKSHRIDVD